MSEIEGERLLTRRQRWARAGVHSAALIGASTAAFLAMIPLLDDPRHLFADSWGDFALWILVPFQLGALTVIVVGAVRSNNPRIGQIVGRALLATLIGAICSAVPWGVLGVAIGLIVGVIAIGPMIVGALIARTAELRACRRRGSQQPMIRV